MGRLPRDGTIEVTTSATPEQVWQLLTDVTRTGEWSHETRGGALLDGATTAVEGARFRGLNGKGNMKWTRTCEVLGTDAPRSISWRTIPTRLYPDSTVWTFTIEPTAEGCRITQQFEVVKIGPIADRLFYLMIPAHRDRTEALTDDLHNLGDVASREVVGGRPGQPV